MPGELVVPAPNVNLKFGPMLIGVLLNMILYGILIMQVLTYHQTYKTDRLHIKLLVWYLFACETANTLLDCAMMYEPLIIKYGTIEAVTFLPSAFASEPVLIALISTPIQFFIAHRIYKISKSFYIPIAICLLGLGSLAGGIWTSIGVATIKRFSRKPELHNPALVWLSCSAAADVLLTASLVWVLYKKKTGFSTTDSMINKIIRLTVQTGMITAICALGDIAFFMALPRTTLNFIWDLVLAKIYANSLMSTLNARASLNSQRSGNPQMQPNFLFDDETGVSSSMSRSFGRRGNMSANHYPSSPHPNVFELESGNKSHLSSFQSPGTYGIAVTIDKVVETMKDPLPDCDLESGSQKDSDLRYHTS